MITYNSIIRPKTKSDAESIGCIFYHKVTTKTKFKVIVLINTGVDYRGKIKSPGVIVNRIDIEEDFYPYVWNISRFEEIL
jgi:hypothetical protein